MARTAAHKQIQKIGLLGCGVVGRGFVHLLQSKRYDIEKKTGIWFDIGSVLVRDLHKNRGVSGVTFTDNPLDILSDPSISVVVELLGGIDPAQKWCEIALKNGKHLVTANKALIAEHGDALSRLACEAGVSLRYEASVGAGIPILSSLEDSLVANDIQYMRGIVNGTCNYILTEMAENKLSFSQALNHAKELGFAEPDPTFDINGMDSAYKLRVVIRKLFGVKVAEESLYYEGIERITLQDIEFADRFGYKIRMLAIFKQDNNGIEMRVHPALVHKTSILAHVRNEFNAFQITGDGIGDMLFYGKGAGSIPTASAVLGDVTSVFVRKALGVQFQSDIRPKPFGTVCLKHYIRLQVIDEPGVLSTITRVLSDHGISVSTVIQPESAPNLEVPIILITHETQESRMSEAIKEILRHNDRIKEAFRIRIE